MSLISELKRRNVFRVALLYVIAGWLILQVADVLFDQLGVPGWAFRLVLALLVLGFPLVLIFSWVFELTPEGLRREKDIHRETSITHQTGRKINIAIIVLLVLAIGGQIADRLIPERGYQASNDSQAAQKEVKPDPQGAAQEATDSSIAVLPFVNISGDADNEYFSDGLTEELLNALARVANLKVTGRTSSFAFKGQNLDLREIGRRLNVAHLLEGSVRKSANRVRITAQLVNSDDGYHLWSQTYDRELDDIFAIQQEIATEVTQALTGTLLGAGAANIGAVGTRNAQAYEAYLRGRYVLVRDPDSPELQAQAETLFRQSLQLDPGFALGEYGLFTVMDWRNRSGQAEAYEDTEQALAEIGERLVATAPELPESYMALGRARLLAWRFDEARAAYETAARMRPGSSPAYEVLASVAALQQELDEGLGYAIKAVDLDPLNASALRTLTWVQSFRGDCAGARDSVKRLLALEASQSRSRGTLALCLLQGAGDAREAIALLDREPLDWLRYTGQAIAWHRLGDVEQARAALDLLTTEIGDSAAYQFAQIHTQWGEPDLAIAWLEKARDIRDPGYVQLLSDPMLGSLRADPRYVGMAEHLRKGMH